MCAWTSRHGVVVVCLQLLARHPWTQLILDAVTTLRGLEDRPRLSNPHRPDNPRNPTPDQWNPAKPSALGGNCHTHQRESKINNESDPRRPGTKDRG